MSLHSIITSTNRTELNASSAIQRLIHSFIYAGFGILGGAIGTAMAIGLAIIVQLMMSPTSTFWPNVTLLAIAATIIGWGVSWVLSRIAPYLASTLAGSDTAAMGLKITLVLSGLTSLLETYLFMSVL